ncbi:MAG: Pyrophosphate--fructose 6-phosphate 1-phosphotransferase [Phycisphaerae bacterium]|nr:Pyrophosphate--fructose 6-phosphate 1-phosphotransferase [Phycisphaerae bacterium]
MAKARLIGKCVVAQSGGPTAVINASACGVIQTAMKNSEIITGCYAGINGILGVLREELFDLGNESSEQIELLKNTPAAALGSCRYKLKPLETDRTDYERILEVFRAHDVRYFFYIGGNDSMDTADKVAKLAAQTGYDLIAVGVPKTIDNDLAETDHCPGYGSVAKFIATTAMEAGRDTEALYTADTATIMEVMGRNAGWIAASAGLANRDNHLDQPHLVYMPEIPFTIDQFVADVKATLARVGRCFVVVGEGLRDAEGNYLSEAKGAFAKDSFGHVQLGGVAQTLSGVVKDRCGVKCRHIMLGQSQRAAAHWASATDVKEAWMAGSAAVKAAVRGVRGKMVTLVRGSRNGRYTCSTGLADLSVVANGEKMVPREFINAAGNGVTEAFKAYLRPLVAGEAKVKVGDDGLPVFTRFARRPIATKCGPWKKA